MFKGLFALLLSLLAAIDLAFWVLDPNFYPVDVIDPAVRLITFLAVLALIMAERVRSFRISPVQFIFFLIYFMAGIFNVVSVTYAFVAGRFPLLPFVTTILTLAMVAASVVVHFFAEPPPKYGDATTVATADMDDKACPITVASFPSILAFSWFSGMAWTGFKRSLTKDDLWQLPPELASASVVPRFMRYWESKVRKVLAHNTAVEALEAKETPPNNVSFNKTDDNVQVKLTEDVEVKTVKHSAKKMVSGHLYLSYLI